MTRQDLITYCLTYPAAYEDYPFDKVADAGAWTVMRHSANKKSFALIYERNGELCVNLKCEPFEAGFLRQMFASVSPAYHMNKQHWNTVTLGGDVPEEELMRMIDNSYDLIKPKARRRNKGKSELMVRPLSSDETEIREAVDLTWRVFLEFEAPEYSKEGTDEFRRFLDGIPENAELQMIGCWKGKTLVGLIAVRPQCHIALLFVDKAYHRQGIARRLWETLLADKAIVNGHRAVTVNSSPYAVEVYERFGFEATDEEQVLNGIRFVPMKYQI